MLIFGSRFCDYPNRLGVSLDNPSLCPHLRTSFDASPLVSICSILYGLYTLSYEWLQHPAVTSSERFLSRLLWLFFEQCISMWPYCSFSPPNLFRRSSALLSNGPYLTYLIPQGVMEPSWFDNPRSSTFALLSQRTNHFNISTLIYKKDMAKTSLFRFLYYK